jgi:hypothetical protein
MQGNSQEQGPFVIKLAIYAAGVLLGLVAKLATLNYERDLSWKEVIFHTSVAFACAWVVWLALASWGKHDVALIAAVIIGRFGDSMLIAIGKALKKSILNLFKGE